MLKTSLLFKKLTTLRANNWIILKIKKPEFSEYYFHMNINMYGDYQVCTSVPLIQNSFFVQ